MLTRNYRVGVRLFDLSFLSYRNSYVYRQVKILPAYDSKVSACLNKTLDPSMIAKVELC